MIYRPHPRSGVVDPEYGAANRRIIAAIAAANAADPAAHHVFDDGPELGWQLAAADVAIVDISAMVYDRLAADKPLHGHAPGRPGGRRSTRTATSRRASGWMPRPRRSIVAETDRVLGDADAVARLEQWVRALLRRHRRPARRPSGSTRAIAQPHGRSGTRGTRARVDEDDDDDEPETDEAELDD